MPRPQLTVRGTMIVVAVLATALGVCVELMRRRERFLAISLEHVGQAAMEGALIITDEGPAYVGIRTENGRWHEAMRRKYDYHGRHPWLPVPPDPPEPELEGR